MLKNKTELWLLHAWFHTPFEDEGDQHLLQKEMEFRGFKFDKDKTIIHAPAIIMAMVNCIIINTEQATALDLSDKAPPSK